MANTVTRTFLKKNLFNLKELSHIFKHSRCTSVFVVNYGQKNISQNTQCNKLCLEAARTHKIQFYSTSNKQDFKCNEKEEKLSLFQRFKQMYKDYWYVLVPVHLVTSAAWFGGFYYLAKSGVDIIEILQSLHVSESVINPLKDSSMGYLAVAYALYKIATPARYTVTLGGTTLSINYLKKWGYIKPVPSKERLKEMYQEKKDNLLETMKETREGLKIKSEQLKDKKDDIMDDFDKKLKKKVTKTSTKD